MPESLATVVGYELEEKPVSSTVAAMWFQTLKDFGYKVSWNKRDLLLYALGIGATSDDFQFVYGGQCTVLILIICH